MCVSEDGGVWPYAPDGALLAWQTSVGEGVSLAHVWPSGVAALSLDGRTLLLLTRLGEAGGAPSRLVRLPVPSIESGGSPVAPHALALRLPAHTPHGGAEALLAVGVTLLSVVRGPHALFRSRFFAPASHALLPVRRRRGGQGHALRAHRRDGGCAHGCVARGCIPSLLYSPFFIRLWPPPAPPGLVSRGGAARGWFFPARRRFRRAFAHTRSPHQFRRTRFAADVQVSPRPSPGRREVCRARTLTRTTPFSLAPSSHLHSGALVALLTRSGRLLVVSSSDVRTPLSEVSLFPSPLGDGPPPPFCWCGADAVLVAAPDGLTLVGPGGATCVWPTDGEAMCLVPEIDGARALSSTSSRLVRRTPAQLRACVAPASTAPGALLLGACEDFDRGSARGADAIRSLGPSAVASAASDCVAAARDAWGVATQRGLLRAACFGYAHVPPALRASAVAAAAAGRCGDYADAVRTLRLLNALRDPCQGGVPLTAAQYDALPGGGAALIARLTTQKRHFLALRVGDLLGVAPTAALLSWVAAKVAASPSLSDRQLADALLERLSTFQGVPYGRCAAAAKAAGRPKLGALLLEHEGVASTAVPLLALLGEEERALSRAVGCGDAELVVLACLCLASRHGGAGSPALAAPLGRHPPSRQLFATFLRRTDGDALRSFLAGCNDSCGGADALVRSAVARTARAPPSSPPTPRDPGGAIKALDAAAELYASAKRPGSAAAASDAARLLKAQQELGAASVAAAPRGGGGGATDAGAYVGLSAADTLLAALSAGHPKAAAKLRVDLRVSDKHWAYIRARAAASGGEWDALCLLAEEKRLACGVPALVDIALSANAPPHALKRLVARVADAAQRAELATAAGLTREAAAAAAEARDQGSSFSKQAQSLFTQTLARLQ